LFDGVHGGAATLPAVSVLVLIADEPGRAAFLVAAVAIEALAVLRRVLNTTSITRVLLPPKLVPVFSGEAMYRGAFGGRGSAQTRSSPG
jgi:hypothetical protein